MFGNEILRKTGRVASRSQTVVANGFVFTVATSAVMSPSLYDQTKSTLEAVDAQLASVGLDKGRIISAIVYITDMARKPEMNRAWEEWVALSEPPVRACIGASLEGEDLVEIVVTAALR